MYYEEQMSIILSQLNLIQQAQDLDFEQLSTHSLTMEEYCI